MCEVSGKCTMCSPFSDSFKILFRVLQVSAFVSLLGKVGRAGRPGSRRQATASPVSPGLTWQCPLLRGGAVLQCRFCAQQQPAYTFGMVRYSVANLGDRRQDGRSMAATCTAETILFPGPHFELHRLCITPDLPLCFILIVHDLNLTVYNRQLLMSPPKHYNFSSYVTKKPYQGK